MTHAVVRSSIRYSLIGILFALQIAAASIGADGTGTSMYSFCSILAGISAVMLLLSSMVTGEKEYLISGVVMSHWAICSFYLGGYSLDIPLPILLKFGMGHIPMVLLAEHCIAQDNQERQYKEDMLALKKRIQSLNG